MQDPHDTSTIDLEEMVHGQTEQLAQQDSDYRNLLQEGLVIIDVMVTGRDGEKTLSNSKMMVEGQELEEKIVRKGRIEWFPRGELKFKNTIETKARRIIAKRGLKYGRVTALPVSELEQLQVELKECEKEFYAEVADRKSRFLEIIDNHKAANPDSAALIDSLVTKEEDFFRRFEFKVLPPMAFKPFFEEDADTAMKSIEESLFEEIVDRANDCLEKVTGKSEVAQRTIKPLHRLRDFIFSMSFNHPVFDNLVSEIDEMFSTVPEVGNVTGTELAIVQKMAMNLTKRDLLTTSILIKESELKEEEEVTAPSVSFEDTLEPYQDSGLEASTSGFSW